jgi:predicted CXXCH cytochrome family protein
LSHFLLGTRRRIVITVCSGALILLLLAYAAIHRYVTHGGLVARQSPSGIETFIATRLVNMSIPDSAKAMKNPLVATANGTDMALGRALYQKNCQGCHGYEGAGKTTTAGGLYPPPPNLAASTTAQRSDGALFYLIRNGVRNTGMPGWQFTDRETWQLVLFLRGFSGAAPTIDISSGGGGAPRRYVGSAACGRCHADIYQRWKTTLMANVVRDPREHPEAIIPDLSKPDPLVTFTAADIAFVYGSKWKQRYFKKIDNDYYPLPAQWDVTHKKWRGYFAKDDWWVAFYPPDNFKRPTSATCDGCHSVNYNISTHAVTEWNVGCEKCHGAGSEHVANPINSTIINPARLNYVQANDTCIQCHSQGRPPANPINGQYYDWPVGFEMGLRLSDFWKLEEHLPGQTTFTHFADGTAHKNRMQGNDFVTSQMYTHGVTCFACHDSHGSENDALLRKPATALCLDCHGPNSPNGPRAATLEAHTHHKAGSAGSECIACHMPKIEQTLGDVNVRTHDFHFITPARTDALKIPNACNVCHTDKSTAWTANALRQWPQDSPWRMAE